jgi:hypothetical protein
VLLAFKNVMLDVEYDELPVDPKNTTVVNTSVGKNAWASAPKTMSLFAKLSAED